MRQVFMTPRKPCSGWEARKRVLPSSVRLLLVNGCVLPMFRMWFEDAAWPQRVEGKQVDFCGAQGHVRMWRTGGQGSAVQADFAVQMGIGGSACTPHVASQIVRLTCFPDETLILCRRAYKDDNASTVINGHGLPVGAVPAGGKQSVRCRGLDRSADRVGDITSPGAFPDGP